MPGSQSTSGTPLSLLPRKNPLTLLTKGEIPRIICFRPQCDGERTSLGSRRTQPNCRVAQLVEHLTLNQGAVGSNPTPASKKEEP